MSVSSLSDAPEMTALDAVTPSPRTTRPRRGKRVVIPKLKPWTIVLIEWADAVLHDGEQHSSNKFTLPHRISVGHFISRTAECITIAMEDDRACEIEASDCDNATSIPLGMICEVKILVPKE